MPRIFHRFRSFSSFFFFKKKELDEQRDVYSFKSALFSKGKGGSLERLDRFFNLFHPGGSKRRSKEAFFAFAASYSKAHGGTSFIKNKNMSFFVDVDNLLVSAERVNSNQIQINPDDSEVQKTFLTRSIPTNARRFLFSKSDGFMVMSKMSFVLCESFLNLFVYCICWNEFIKHVSLSENQFELFSERFFRSPYSAPVSDLPVVELPENALCERGFAFCEVLFRNRECADAQIQEFVNMFSQQGVKVQSLGIDLNSLLGFNCVKQSFFDAITFKSSLTMLYISQIREQNYIDAIGDYLSSERCKLNGLSLGICLDNEKYKSFLPTKLVDSLAVNKSLKCLTLRDFDIDWESSNSLFTIGNVFLVNNTLTFLNFFGFYRNDSKLTSMVVEIAKNTNSLKCLCAPASFWLDFEFVSSMHNALMSNISIVNCGYWNKTHKNFPQHNAEEFKPSALRSFLVETTKTMFLVLRKMDRVLPPYVLLEIVDWLPRRLLPHGTSDPMLSIMHKVQHNLKIDCIFGVCKSIEEILAKRKEGKTRFVKDSNTFWLPN